MAHLNPEQHLEHLYSECCELRRQLNEKDFVFGAQIDDLKKEIASQQITIAELNQTINELNSKFNDCVPLAKYNALEVRLEECQKHANVTNISENYAKMLTVKNEECLSLLKQLAAKEELLAANQSSIKSMVASIERYSAVEEELAKTKRELSECALQKKSLMEEIESLRNSTTNDDKKIKSNLICDEPMKIDTPTIGNPILSFRSKKIQFGTPDENESPTTFSLSFKRPQPMQRNAVQSKRNRSLFPKNMNVMNTNPEIELSIMKAVQKADQDPNLIGDFTKPYALPLIANSKHQDLKAITSETLASVIKGEFNEFLLKVIIVDCRYPYEYEGGHIIGAKNIYTQQQILAEFFDEKTRNDHKVADSNGKRNVVIFHCEFSSERGPSLYRYLRTKDRELNEYPNLYHPEVYLLNGGYKAFYESFKELCVPQQYLPMLSKDHKDHLRQFRLRSKSWNCENKFAGSTFNLQRQ